MTDTLRGKLEALRGKTTEGPWEYSGDEDGDFIVWGASPADEFIANVDESAFVPVPPTRVAFDINQANAQLIALAPDMAKELLAADSVNERLLSALKSLMKAAAPELSGSPKNIPKSRWAAEWDEAEAAIRDAQNERGKNAEG